MKTSAPITEAVEIVGSQSALAETIGKSQQHISFLCLGKYRPSAEDAIAIERATEGKVARHHLRPDLWPPPIAGARRATADKREVA